MSPPWQTLLQCLRGNRGKHWSRARRRAALRELEERFHTRLSEEEVFQAASLFFSLLADGAFIDKDAIRQEVRRQLAAYSDMTKRKEA